MAALRRILSLPGRFRPWRALPFRLILEDVTGLPTRVGGEHRAHLAAAIDWLCLAQDVRDDHGDAGSVSAGWSFENGWLPGYPETSGYIVETLLAAAAVLERPELRTRANRILDWELRIQHADGAFPGHFGEPGSHPVIFNTGQIMHGMLAGYLQLGRTECLEAAVRAGRWMARLQDEDGCWRRFEHNGIPHTYNTRATWALAVTARAAGDAALERAAVRNLDWALAQQMPSGWFANNAFTVGVAPFTHTIAYAIRGLIECGDLLGDPRYVHAGVRAASALAAAQRPDGWLAGTYDAAWRATSRYCCLTGIAQMALNWMRCDQVTGTSHLRENARRGMAYLKTRHRVDDRDPIVRGALAGSAPIWGRYSMFEFPNWAAKFFADALMMDLYDSRIPPAPQASPAWPQRLAHV